MVRAMRAAVSRVRAGQRRRYCARSTAGRRAQALWAPRAAAMARSTSAWLDRGERASTAPVAGLVTSCSSALSVKLPAMKLRSTGRDAMEFSLGSVGAGCRGRLVRGLRGAIATQVGQRGLAQQADVYAHGDEAAAPVRIAARIFLARREDAAGLAGGQRGLDGAAYGLLHLALAGVARMAHARGQVGRADEDGVHALDGPNLGRMGHAPGRPDLPHPAPLLLPLPPP